MTARKLLDKLNTVVLLVLGAVALATAGPSIDRLFPVVYPFEVTQSSKTNTSITIAGWAKKVRDCKPIEITVLAYKNDIASLGTVEFLDTVDGSIPSRPRSDDIQFWGPWKLHVPVNTQRVEISALHRCHVLWNTRTYYKTIYLEDING